jgi:hypothetical protein
MPQQFFDQDAFAGHVKTTHKTVRSDAEIAKVSKLSARPSLTPFSCCPFCDFTAPDLTSAPSREEKAPAEKNATLRVIEAQTTLRKHIAGHLIQFFLLALPDRTDVQDLGSDRTGSLQARSTVLALQDVVPEFSDEEVLELAVPHLSDDLSAMAEDWDFVEDDLIARGVRKIYAGHEIDHNLKPFVNRLDVVLNGDRVRLPPPEIVCIDPEGFEVEVAYSW